MKKNENLTKALNDCVQNATYRNGIALFNAIYLADNSECRDPRDIGMLYALMQNNNTEPIYEVCFNAYNLRRRGFRVAPCEYTIEERHPEENKPDGKPDCCPDGKSNGFINIPRLTDEEVARVLTAVFGSH